MSYQQFFVVLAVVGRSDKNHILSLSYLLSLRSILRFQSNFYYLLLVLQYHASVWFNFEAVRSGLELDGHQITSNMTASISWLFLTAKVELKVMPVSFISAQSTSISLIHIINANLAYPPALKYKSTDQTKQSIGLKLFMDCYHQCILLVYQFIYNNNMGNTCEECDQTDNKKDFAPIASYQQGLKKNIELLPIKEDFKCKDSEISFGTKTQLPKLTPKLQEILRRELSANPLALSSTHKGIEKPTEFLSEKGLYYQGEWLDHQPHGKGHVYFPGGSYLEAYFNKGEAECKDAILLFADGSFYRGEINKSVFDGRGKLTTTGGMSYIGEWKNGVPDGEGEEIFANGNNYKGGFRKGLKSGNGVFRWSDGKLYEGQFRNGKMHGQGKLTQGEQLFEGIFEQNKKIGKCKLKTAHGTYNSQFTDGQITGEGTFEWKNHTIYRGGLLKGLPHGQGTIEFPNGNTIVGYFQHGVNVKTVDMLMKAQTRQ